MQGLVKPMKGFSMDVIGDICFGQIDVSGIWSEDSSSTNMSGVNTKFSPDSVASVFVSVSVFVGFIEEGRNAAKDSSKSFLK